MTVYNVEEMIDIIRDLEKELTELKDTQADPENELFGNKRYDVTRTTSDSYQDRHLGVHLVTRSNYSSLAPVVPKTCTNNSCVITGLESEVGEELPHQHFTGTIQSDCVMSEDTFNRLQNHLASGNHPTHKICKSS